MSSQFVHIECYSLTPPKKTRKNAAPKWSAGDILAEAARMPGACDHIAVPMPPTLIYGATLVELETELGKIQANARDAAGRHLRKDATILLGGVASYPAHGSDYQAWRQLTVDWLHGQFGANLRAIVEHLDEQHPHLHFFVTDPARGNVKNLHPGFVAAQNAPNPLQQRKAFTEAMQAFQDDYWSHVGCLVGMARVGPRRRRLTREEWAQEQADLRTQAAKLKAVQDKTEKLRAQEERLSVLAENTIAQTKRLLRELDAAEPAAKPETPGRQSPDM